MDGVHQMSAPIIANAAVISASSLVIQNSARQLSTQAQQTTPVSLTEAQEYAVIGQLGVLVVVLLLATVVIIRTTLDLFR
jgi:hypothetical protein